MRASTCSQNESPPTINSCRLVTSTIKSLHGLSGNCIFLWGRVDMPLISIFFSGIPCLLILVKQLLMLLDNKLYRILAHIYYTLQQSHFCISRLLLDSHHSLYCLFFPHPVETKNRREDLHVVVCPWVHSWVYYP